METLKLNPGWISPRQLHGTEFLLLPAAITEAASQRTYYIIRLLVDRNRTQDAYRAYAYFRWVDDWLDQTQRNRADRLDFVERQQMIIESGVCGDYSPDLTAEEQMVIDLIRVR